MAGAWFFINDTCDGQRSVRSLWRGWRKKDDIPHSTESVELVGSVVDPSAPAIYRHTVSSMVARQWERGVR